MKIKLDISLSRPGLMVILLLLSSQFLFAQTWLNNYSYRKKITIAKNKVFSTGINLPVTSYADLVDFPVLLVLTDSDLIQIPGSCANKIRNIAGRDIAFCLSSAATVKLSFELENYDPATGKLICWVKIPVLSSNMTATAATSIYFYYGSDVLHNPETAGLEVWPAESYSRVWHMNRDFFPSGSKNAQSNSMEQALKGSPGMDMDNYVPAITDKGILLNGSTESLSSGIDAHTTLTISAWIKLNTTGTEQVLITNDSTTGSGSSGYVLKINNEGSLVAELRKPALTNYTHSSSTRLLPHNWYFVTLVSSGRDLTMYINGIGVGGKSNTSLRLGNGGSVKVGCDKQHTSYLNGIVDELRILKTMRTANWLQTEYANQLNPEGFYQIDVEEYDPKQTMTFTGVISNLWGNASNWNSGTVPSTNTNVVIAAGKTAQINGNMELSINRLLIEPGATLAINVNTTINCVAVINSGATLKLGTETNVKFGADIINNGNIVSEDAGTLVFSGGQLIQRFSGSGITKVSALKNNQAMATGTLLMEAPIQVTETVNLMKGILNANGNLTLCSSESGDAELMPVLTNEAAITGNVQVQKYISGNYPAPSTARGWRLLSSPVYQSTTELQHYHVSSLKNSMFITGSGGIANGFDASPLNSATVYTHDQAIPGTLAQKYKAISNMNATIPLGRGIYVFSRGNRNVPNAYEQQVSTSPFSNPSSYTVTYTGKIYTGELTVGLKNRNEGKDGDGFNLLGNPYPASLTWGSLNKENVASFIWQFDPLNNAYMVSDLPNTIIPSGTGFFVKVNSGHTTGSLTFKELAKHRDAIGQNARIMSSRLSETSVPENRLEIKLNKGIFNQQCILVFKTDGKEEINDRDALKLGEGYVNLATMAGETRLSFDERLFSSGRKEIALYVKGWESGTYNLNFIGLESFGATTIRLIDHYTNKQQDITVKQNVYNFYIDQNIADSFGTKRLSLLLEPNTSSVISKPVIDKLIYPNPFSTVFYLKNINNMFKDSELIMRNTSGKILIKKKLNINDETFEIDGSGLNAGIYLIQIRKESNKETIFVSKLLKQ